MKIAYLIFLIGYLIASSSNDKVIDINVYEKNEVDKYKYPHGIIPSKTDFYYRAKIEPNSRMQIQIGVYKGSSVGFHLDICTFKDHPSDMEVLTVNDKCEKGLRFYRQYSSGDYDFYGYDFKTGEGVNYLSAHLSNYYSLYYLSFGLYKIPHH